MQIQMLPDSYTLTADFSASLISIYILLRLSNGIVHQKHATEPD